MNRTLLQKAAKWLQILKNIDQGLAVLVDPEKFILTETEAFLKKIPVTTNLILVGGSTATQEDTKNLVIHLKSSTSLPVILFPGSHEQLCHAADAVLFLSLVSGRNPKYLIEEQIKAVDFLTKSNLEVIPTGYILVDGGNETSVQRVSETKAIPTTDIELIVKTAKACEYMGKQVVYLEAGSGAKNPIPSEIIKQVSEQISIPLVVGGGIRSNSQREAAYQAGANWVVMGTFFETV